MYTQKNMKLCIFSAFSVHKDVHSCDGLIVITVISMVFNEMYWLSTRRSLEVSDRQGPQLS